LVACPCSPARMVPFLVKRAYLSCQRPCFLTVWIKLRRDPAAGATSALRGEPTDSVKPPNLRPELPVSTPNSPSRRLGQHRQR
jgi:hypothetical protein